MIKKLSFISVFVLCFCATSVNAQAVANSSNGLDQRVTERLKRLKIELSESQTEIIKDRCEQAQGKLKAVQKSAAVYSLSQEETINKVLDDLTGLKESLSDRSADTVLISDKIDKINELKTKVDSTYKNYILAVEDSAAIDCKSSPEGFRLSLDDAKKQFAELTELRKSLVDLIKIELRGTLVEIKDNL